MKVQYGLAILSALAVTSFVPPASAADVAAGQQVYLRTCAMCHGPNGRSPLPYVPDFHQPGGVLSQPDSVLLDRIEHGYKSDRSPIAMPPKGGNARLQEQDLKNVLAYLHQAFGAESGSAATKNAPPPDNQGDGASGWMGRGMMGRGMMGTRMHGGGMMGR